MSMIPMSINFSDTEEGSPQSNQSNEESFDRSIHNALFNLGRTDFGSTMILPESAVWPPGMVNKEYERFDLFI